MGVTEALVQAAIEYRKLYATDLDKETCFLGGRQRALLEAVDAYRKQEAEPVSSGPRLDDAPTAQRQGVARTVASRWYPVECEHGWDHCPKCDALEVVSDDRA